MKKFELTMSISIFIMFILVLILIYSMYFYLDSKERERYSAKDCLVISEKHNCTKIGENVMCYVSVYNKCPYTVNATLSLETSYDIPSKSEITNFCKSKNYKYGWLDSHSCDKNQVMCFKEIGNAKYYDCKNINE